MSTAERGGISARFLAAGLLWPTLFAVPVLVFLLGLGNWQLQRKAWKEALLAQLAARAAEAPVTLAEAVRRQRAGEGIEFLRVAVTGRFRHRDELHYFAPSKPVQGWAIFTPMTTSDGFLVYVERGVVPHDLKDAAKRPAGQIDGEARVLARIRAPEQRTWFTPVDDIARNVHHRRDPIVQARNTARAMAIPAEKVPAFYLQAEAEPANPGGWPRGGAVETRTSNRHLEYAVTWFGLAATLIGVYVAFARARFRASKPLNAVEVDAGAA